MPMCQLEHGICLVIIALTPRATTTLALLLICDWLVGATGVRRTPGNSGAELQHDALGLSMIPKETLTPLLHF